MIEIPFERLEESDSIIDVYNTTYAGNPLSSFLITFLNPQELLQPGSNFERTSDAFPFKFPPL